MLEQVWNTFDALFKTVQSYGRRLEELETRLAALEREVRKYERPVLTAIDGIISANHLTPPDGAEALTLIHSVANEVEGAPPTSPKE